MKKLLTVACAVSVLTGCAYRTLNPQAAAADERNNNGYEALQSVEPDAAKVVLRTRGSSNPVEFSTSTSTPSCRGFTTLGYAVYSGRGVVLPWIATMTEKTRGVLLKERPYLAYDAKPGQALQVRGASYAQVGKLPTEGQCGPVVSKFTPQAGKAYLVEFAWGDKPACRLEIFDATNPDAPVPVPAEELADCAAPG